MVEVMKIMATSFKRSHACIAAVSAPDPATGHCGPTPPLETPGHSRASLGQSLVGSLLLSPGSWCTQGSVCALQESVSPVLCKFWWLYGRVNGDLLQEGLCHTQVCCTQSPCPCDRPLLTRSSAFSKSNLNIWKFMVHVKRSPSKMVGGVKSCLESNPIPARDAQRAQTYLVRTRTQILHRD